MPEQALHELVREYRRSGEGLKEIILRVGKMLYCNPERYGFDDEDDAADAYQKYRARIVRMADRYEDRGQPFEAYLSANLRFIARTVRRTRRRAREREEVCERAEADRAFAETRSQGLANSSYRFAERMAQRRDTSLAPKARMTEAAFGERLVFLAVKCAWDMDDEDIERVAASAGVGAAWLASAVAQARRSLEPYRARFEALAAKRNSSWCRIRLLEKKMEERRDSAQCSVLAESLVRERLRFERARQEIAAFRPVVPNSIVARILGIPKGTVDSGLYYLRVKCSRNGSTRAGSPRTASDAPSESGSSAASLPLGSHSV